MPIAACPRKSAGAASAKSSGRRVAKAERSRIFWSARAVSHLHWRSVGFWAHRKRSASAAPSASTTEAEKAARKNRVVDEDGFELVTYKRKSYASETPAEPRKKKKTLALDNFYRFQIRDKKREELAVLRNKFEASPASLRPLLPLLHTCAGARLCVAAFGQHDCHLPAMRCIRYRVALSARLSPPSGQ